MTFVVARKHCDRLIVGIDDDDSVRALKGPGRPIFSAETRAIVVQAVWIVDLTVVFAAAELEPLIAAIAPDVLVKGEEYRGRPIIGAEHAKEIVYAPMAEGCSTTEIIRRLSCVSS